MKTIINSKEITYYKDKSKFIGLVYHVDNPKEIDEKLADIRRQYPDATHIVYAYILLNTMKYSDDFEPAKTAGYPILELLKKNHVQNVLAIVIRYFGGIKLGSNGLIRAYSHAIKETLQDNLKDIQEGYLITIEEDWTMNKQLDYLLKSSRIIKKEYQDKIKITVIVDKKTLEKLSNVHYQIIKEITY